MTDHVVGVARPTGAAWNLARLARIATFAVFAMLILLGPFAAQVFQVHHILARPWTMFSGAGVGILRGEFRAVARDGSATTLTPLQVLGFERYPATYSTDFELRVVEDADVRRFAQKYCLANRVELSFAGAVGTRHGWRTLKADNLCAHR